MKIISERGQSIVEFALILPIVLLLVMGTIDFGMLFLTKSRVEAASSSAARMAALGDSDSEIDTAVQGAFPGDNTVQVTISPEPASSRTQGSQVDVKVTKQYQFLTPFISPLFGSSAINLSSDTFMVMEVTPTS